MVNKHFFSSLNKKIEGPLIKLNMEVFLPCIEFCNGNVSSPKDMCRGSTIIIEEKNNN